MNDESTQAREFIGLLEEAGLADERIDYYVDKLADGTFDLAELESELTGRSRELSELITEGAAVADELEGDVRAGDAETASQMSGLADDHRAEMAAISLGAEAEADMIETSVTRKAEGEARAREGRVISKIKTFLKDTN